MDNPAKKKDRHVTRIGYFFMKHMLKRRRNPAKIRLMLQGAGLGEKMTILDYGAGVGNHTIEAAKIVGPKGTVLAVDVSKSMLDALEKTCVKEHVANVETQLIDSYEDITRRIDVVFLFDVLHFIAEKEVLIRYLFGLLNPGGHILIKFDHFRRESVEALLSRCACGTYSYLPSPDLWKIKK